MMDVAHVTSDIGEAEVPLAPLFHCMFS